MTARRIAKLIDTHGAALVLFARQWSSAPEDVVQDAFCKLAEQSQWPVEPIGWLYRVVRNRAIDSGRSERRRQHREVKAARPERWFAESVVDGLDAEAAISALESIPPEQREVIVARLWGGMTLEQIANIAGCSVSSAHRRFEAGIATLRQKLGASCPTDPTR